MLCALCCALCAGRWCNLSSWVTSWTSQTFWMCFEKQREVAGLFISRVSTFCFHLSFLCSRLGMHAESLAIFEEDAASVSFQNVNVDNQYTLKAWTNPQLQCSQTCGSVRLLILKVGNCKNWLRTWEIKTSHLKVIPNTNFLEIPVYCLHLESQVLTEQFCCFETALCSAETGSV